MWEEFRNRPAIDEIRELQPQARDNIFLADCGGLARQLPASLYREKLVKGDLSRVEESDKFLAKLEDEIPHSRTWHNVVSITGSLPIIPAYLAGHPQNMRQRTRLRKPVGPLSIFLECTGSSGSMSHANMRGAAMLALVRVLNEYRPVDLWLCVTYGDAGRMHGMLIRIETRPLDLAHAAHILCSMNETSYFGAEVMRAKGCSWLYGWAYGVPNLERTWCGEIFKRFLHPGSDVLYVPAAYLVGEAWNKPVEWIKDMLKRYGGETVEREDD